MTSEQLRPPSPDQLEISLFGPGYGEAIALHIGLGQWILIDSCVEPASGRPASLKYLQQLGFDASQSVKLIVATHWHDDHIAGLSSLFQECTASSLAIPAVLDTNQLLELITAYSEYPLPRGSGVSEFINIFSILNERKKGAGRFNPPIFAKADLVLFNQPVPVPEGQLQRKMYSLSPSDSCILESNMAHFIPREGEQRI